MEIVGFARYHQQLSCNTLTQLIYKTLRDGCVHLFIHKWSRDEMKHVTIVIIAVVTLAFAFPGIAGEPNKPIHIQPSQVLKYLSENERTQFFEELIRSEIIKGNISLDESDDSNKKIEFSIPLYKADESNTPRGRPNDNSSKSNDGPSSQFTTGPGLPQGNVGCDIAAHNPHAGSGPGGSRVVKAKSSGTCEYIEVYPPGPPYISWTLWQGLIRNPSGPFAGDQNWVTYHDRQGLDVAWSSSSTQVFANDCINDFYLHYDFVIFNVPPPWYVFGPNYFILGTSTATVNNC